MTPDCRHFEKCGAPICPMMTSKGIVWFPGEDVCKLKETEFASRQRSIARKTRYPDTCYTQTMLERNGRLTKGITGLNPNYPIAEQEGTWLAKHPTAIPMSEAKREAVRERLKKYRIKGK